MTWTLHQGDCLDGMAALPPKSVDVLISDPPYSEHTHSKQRRGCTGYVERRGSLRAANNRAVDLGFAALPAWKMALAAGFFARIVRRWVVLFCDDFQEPVWRAKLTKVGLEVLRVGGAWAEGEGGGIAGAWVKLHATPQFSGDRPGVGLERIIIAHPPGRKRWNGGGHHATYAVPTVLNRSGAAPSRLHTTQKPLTLMEQLVADFSDPGDLVLDPYAGSGTTGVAALRLGRRFLGWEIDAKYADVARARMGDDEARCRVGESSQRAFNFKAEM